MHGALVGLGIALLAFGLAALGRSLGERGRPDEPERGTPRPGAGSASAPEVKVWIPDAFKKLGVTTEQWVAFVRASFRTFQPDVQAEYDAWARTNAAQLEVLVHRKMVPALVGKPAPGFPGKRITLSALVALSDRYGADLIDEWLDGAKLTGEPASLFWRVTEIF